MNSMMVRNSRDSMMIRNSRDSMKAMMSFESVDAELEELEMAAVARKPGLLVIPCRVSATVTACPAWAPRTLRS